MEEYLIHYSGLFNRGNRRLEKGCVGKNTTEFSKIRHFVPAVKVGVTNQSIFKTEPTSNMYL
jgi:hypothetical protein